MFLLVSLAAAWSNTLLVTAFELGMRSVDARYRQKIVDLFASAGDNLNDATQAVTWLYDVENPPYNIISFRHWHFTQTPTDDSRAILHNNTDNVCQSIMDFERNLFASSITKPWPFSLAFKAYLTLICDIHAMFHVSELISDEFPIGDNNAKNYSVVYKGKTDSLLSVWENGCDVFAGNDVNKSVDELLKMYPSEYGVTINWKEVTEATRQETIAQGYANVKPGQELTTEYIANCQKVSAQQVAKAGHAIGSALKRISIPKFENQGVLKSVGASEMVAWTVLCFVIPMAAFSVAQKFCSSCA